MRPQGLLGQCRGKGQQRQTLLGGKRRSVGHIWSPGAREAKGETGPQSMKDMACPTAGSCKKRSVAMKRLFSTRRGLVVGTAVLGIVSLGVAAFAYWTSSGSSNGSATTAAIGPWTVVAPVVTAADLSPGGSVDTTSYSVTNGGTGNQHLTAVDISVANSDGS